MRTIKNKRYKVIVTKDKKFNEDIVMIKDSNDKKDKIKTKRPKMTKEAKKQLRDFILFSGFGALGAFLIWRMQDNGSHWGLY